MSVSCCSGLKGLAFLNRLAMPCFNLLVHCAMLREKRKCFPSLYQLVLSTNCVEPWMSSLLTLMWSVTFQEHLGRTLSFSRCLHLFIPAARRYLVNYYVSQWAAYLYAYDQSKFMSFVCFAVIKFLHWQPRSITESVNIQSHENNKYSETATKHMSC